MYNKSFITQRYYKEKPNEPLQFFFSFSSYGLVVCQRTIQEGILASSPRLFILAAYFPNQYNLALTRLPFVSLPSNNVPFPYPQATKECSPILATECSSSVMTEGQLSLKYLYPSVSITAEKNLTAFCQYTVSKRAATETFNLH